MVSQEPIEYKRGYTEFAESRIDLSFRPLIPRVETEFWVKRAIQNIKKKKERSLKVLDIFAGSGCIGTAVLRHLPNARVDFAEKEEKLIEQIKKNLALNNIAEDRARVVQSDMFENIPLGSTEDGYDYIFANPPYISRAHKNIVQESVLDWECENYYFADDNGLFYIKKLLDKAPAYLNQKGKMYIEFDSWQKPSIAQYAQDAGWNKIEFLRDQYKRWRLLLTDKRYYGIKNE